ncbi:MAG: 4Fe-4S binding protein [Alistipes finegoldii]
MRNRATLRCSTVSAATMPTTPRANRCIACGLCQSACPTDHPLTTETVADPGRARAQTAGALRVRPGACMFCHLCVNACPTGRSVSRPTSTRGLHARKARQNQ